MPARRTSGVGEATAIKSMTSQVNWALLGLLIERPDYRYRLERRFESAYGDVLSFGSPSHIHTALKELLRRGLIEKVPGRRPSNADTDGRQTGPHYRATSTGVDGYREWMLAQTWETRRQSRLFARQLAVLACEPQVALEILEHHQRACLSETVRTPRAEDREKAFASPTRELADRLAAEDTRLAAQGALPWINYARAEFKALKESREGPQR